MTTSSSLAFNHAPADYCSPAYLARQARREQELLELRRCRVMRPEIMHLTAKPKPHGAFIHNRPDA